MADVFKQVPLAHANDVEHRRLLALGIRNSFPKSGLAPTNRTYTGVTANYTIAEADYLINVTSGSPTITLPTAVGIQGREYCVKNSGAGTVTVDGTGSETIDGSTTKSFGQYTSITVISDGSNWVIV